MEIEIPLERFNEVFVWYPRMRGKVLTWLQENNIEPPAVYKNVQHRLRGEFWPREYYCMFFKNEFDAILFKLRWG